MVFISVFLMNMLCAMVPCDPNNAIPEIDGLRGSGGGGFSMGGDRFRSKRLISGTDNYPVVKTEHGAVQGYPMMVMSGRRIFAFEGIPYGDAPVRFKDATPAKNWTGIRKAFQPGPHCLQIHAGKMFRVIGSENCLTLNVYTPKIPSRGRDPTKNNTSFLPVIVFIHGGSFTFGAGAEFGPSYLLEKEVILVSMNYRVGVLGFMSTGDTNSPGNYGLKDQALSLKWVADNVHSFGGDPKSVTLMGQSAGSVSVHLHMMNPSSQKYFHRAVLLSGTAYNYWGVQTPAQAKRWTYSLAKLVNCHTTTRNRHDEIVACFRKIDPNWLVGAQMNLFDWIPFPPVLFAPVIEAENSSASPFMTESPEIISQSGKEAKIPAIFGMTLQEGYISNYALNGLMKIGSFINDVPKYLPFYLDYYHVTKNNPTFQRNITESVLNFYLSGSKTTPRNTPMTTYGEMVTDRLFGFGINKAIKSHARYAPTYASLFSFLGKYNQGNLLGVPPKEKGVAHTEDLFYVFNASLYLQGFMQKDEEAQLSKIMVNLLTNFAIKGEPLYSDKNKKGDVRIWDAVSEGDEEVQFLQLNKDIQMIQDPFVKRRKFWESLNLSDMQMMKKIPSNLTVTQSQNDDLNLV